MALTFQLKNRLLQGLNDDLLLLLHQPARLSLSHSDCDMNKTTFGWFFISKICKKLLYCSWKPVEWFLSIETNKPGETNVAFQLNYQASC